MAEKPYLAARGICSEGKGKPKVAEESTKSVGDSEWAGGWLSLGAGKLSGDGKLADDSGLSGADELEGWFIFKS